MLQAGDIALIKKVHGFRWLQESIAWWCNSQYSHCEPLLDAWGASVDFTVPRAKASNIQHYFNGQWRVTILRPVNFTVEQQTTFSSCIGHLVGVEYDVMSYVSFVLNKPLQDKEKYNCADGSLMGYQAAGLLQRHSGCFISPQSYYEYYTAGLFDLVYHFDCAVKGDFSKILT